MRGLWIALAATGCLADGGNSGLCATAPVTTWDNFGAGFVAQSCDTCHSATTLDRHGAPPDVTFDTEEEVWEWSDRILERTTGETPTMPPQGGVSDDDRYRLEVWLTCGGLTEE